MTGRAVMPPIAPNLVDRVVAYVAPGLALSRMRDRTFLALSGAWTGARVDRTALQRWFTSVGSANADTLPDLDKLRQRSRDLVRNAPLAGGAINSVCTSVVGVGLKMFPRIDREVLGLTDEQATAWEKNAARIWRLWSESKECDLQRQLNFRQMQELVLRSTLENGDTFAVNRFKRRVGGPFGYKLQLVEADRVSNPNNGTDTPLRMGGVEIDTDGAPIAYYIADRHPGELSTVKINWARVPAFGAQSGRRLVLHLFAMRRIGQLRGVPYLAPVIEILKQMSRYSDAEIMAAVVNSCFAITTETDDGEGLGLPESAGGETNAKGDPIEIVDAGTIVDLGPNEKINSFTPGRPNSAFEAFMQALARQVGVALELPYEVLIKHFTASYSAARAALLEAWKFFRKVRTWLADELCQPVYENVLEEAIAQGWLEAPGFFDDPLVRRAWCGARWVGPGMGQIQENAETDAAVARIDAGLSTIEEETARITGGDFDENHVQRVKEARMRRRDGLDVEGTAARIVTESTQQQQGQPRQDPDKPEQPDKPEDQEQDEGGQP